jgi:hypothetical protein
MDRLKADFIASLPMRPDRAASCLLFERQETSCWFGVDWGRPQNATTFERREKRAKRGSAGRNGMEKKFLQAERSGKI